MLRLVSLVLLLSAPVSGQWGGFGGGAWAPVWEQALNPFTQPAQSWDEEPEQYEAPRQQWKPSSWNDEDELQPWEIEQKRREKEELEHKWKPPPKPACPKASAYFDKEVGFREVGAHPEFEAKGNVGKIVLTKNKAKKFFAVSSPWDPEANVKSWKLREIEQPSDDEAAKKRALRNKKHWSEERMGQDRKTLADLKQKGQEKSASGSESESLAWLKSAFAKHRQNESSVDLGDEKDNFASFMKTHDNNTDDKMDVWYINMKGKKERKECITKQLLDMDPPIHGLRFPALQFPDCTDQGTFEECIKKSGFGDCIEGGIDFGATGTHGSYNSNEWAIRSAVISNWCGHKRLFQKLEEDKKSRRTKPAKYAVVLEDDVILDREWFGRVMRDFATNYENKDWHLVQVDPFGSMEKKDHIGSFRGKPVFKAAMGGCSQFWGFHAVIVRTDALPEINAWMSTSKAIPIDWMPVQYPHSLAFSGLVSRNPEATLNGETIVLPKYCSEGVKESTIAR